MEAAQSASTSAREFAFSRADFEAIAGMLHREAGIEMPPAKEPLVYSRLAKRLRALGLTSFKDYLAVVKDPAAEERGHMLSALTTNVTRFFREPHHFDDLSAKQLPELIARARGGGRVRLWSAGSSTGMEAYSMALCLLNAAPDAGALDIRILATDINPHVLATGKEGVYDADALREAPAALRDKWFEKIDGGKLRAAPALRGLVSFLQLNLIGDWPMKGLFDVIFCRNVAIYFDEPTQQRIWERLAHKLPPGGRLNIGHSERIAGPAAVLLTNDGVTAYRRVEGRA
jgi:chemotaxis protein methyltransferase CheR